VGEKMSLLINWLESLSIDLKITERCSRNISPKSSCVLCVSHCYSQALSFDNNKVIVDLKKCNACGDCTVVCPVVAVEGTIPKRSIVNGMFAYSTDYCPTVKELLIYRKKGVKVISIPEKCQDERWVQVITEVNDLIIQLGMEPFALDHTEEQRVSRRELLLSVKKKGRDLAKDLTPASWRMGADTWSLPVNFPEDQFYQVELDTETCTICQACFDLCPQKVFAIHDSQLMIDQQKCTNCTLCTDICPEKAIQVNEDIAKKITKQYTLVTRKCFRCASSFYSFHETEHCHVCANKPSDWLMP
jgi:ferredoxin